MENATGLFMRNVHWMIQAIGVDGFRLDAARHLPRWVLNYFDQAMFLRQANAAPRRQPKPRLFVLRKVADSAGFIQPFIRKDIDNNNRRHTSAAIATCSTFRCSARCATTSRATAPNNWHSIRNASLDTNDDGLRNGSQGVSFVDSHDEAGGFPGERGLRLHADAAGQRDVYTNAKEFGDDRSRPNFSRSQGKVDALGGFYGETITKLVEIRNSHGRGNFHERWIDDAFNPNGFSNIYVYERSKSASSG